MQVEYLIHEMKKGPSVFVFDAVPAVCHYRVNLAKNAQMNHCILDLARYLQKLIHRFGVDQTLRRLLLHILEII